MHITLGLVKKQDRVREGAESRQGIEAILCIGFNGKTNRETNVILEVAEPSGEVKKSRGSLKSTI